MVRVYYVCVPYEAQGKLKNKTGLWYYYENVNKVHTLTPKDVFLLWMLSHKFHSCDTFP